MTLHPTLHCIAYTASLQLCTMLHILSLCNSGVKTAASQSLQLALSNIMQHRLCVLCLTSKSIQGLFVNDSHFVFAHPKLSLWTQISWITLMTSRQMTWAAGGMMVSIHVGSRWKRIRRMVISSEWTSAGVNPRMTPVPIVCTAYTLCIIQAHSSRGGLPTLQVCKTRAGTNAAIWVRQLNLYF